MKIILLNGSSVPLYEQIKNAFKENILSENLSFDQQLPSVRELSKELKVSILTVKKAYDELEKEGFIVIRQGIGTFVAAINQNLQQEELQKELENHLIEATKLSKLLSFDEEAFVDFVKFIYQGDN